MRALISSALKATNLQDLVANGSIAGAGLKHKPATAIIPEAWGFAHRIEESWPIGA